MALLEPPPVRLYDLPARPISSGVGLKRAARLLIVAADLRPHIPKWLQPYLVVLRQAFANERRISRDCNRVYRKIGRRRVADRKTLADLLARTLRKDVKSA